MQKNIIHSIQRSVSQKTDKILYQELPSIFLELLRKYFRIEISGVENLPRKGAGLITPNHSGFAGLDAMLLSHLVRRETQRLPRVMTHKFWFQSEFLAKQAKRLGFIEATYDNGLSALKKNNLLILFPEAEKGNFKPSAKMYELQKFHTGAVRMALATHAPIIPCLILGAEESQINLTELEITAVIKKLGLSRLTKLSLPLPLIWLPLPTKWHVYFLPPLYYPYLPSESKNETLIQELTTDLQETMQENLLDLVSRQPSRKNKLLRTRKN
jgi:1-acyl-sn-glycerol-3-phosphate acyltransferase